MERQPPRTAWKALRGLLRLVRGYSEPVGSKNAQRGKYGRLSAPVILFGGNNMENKYAVVVTYSFDPDVPVRLFKEYDEARDYLKADWEKEVKIDTEENEWDTDYEISAEGDYARITNRFADRDDVTEWRIGTVNP